MARKTGNLCIPAEPKLALVIRIRGISGLEKRCQIVNGTFVKLNKASVNMVRLVELYIAWGDLKLGNEWTYKCGYGKINKK
ncbi:hypothetical protein GH733_011286 [Mirounga leonina]|nr:hypothetical protein GH733_011286 [Mirounga leonina]